MMTPRLMPFFFLAGLFLASGCATRQMGPTELELRAPTVLPNVTRAMQTPGFWAGRQVEPDKIILSETEISQFNAELRQKHLVVDLTALGPTISGRTLRKELLDIWKGFPPRKYFRVDGKPVDAAFLDAIKNNIFLDGIADAVPVRLGFVVHYADERLLPTDEPLLEEPGDVDFDQLQNSALDVGSVVAIFHESRDGKWFYCQGEAVPGWIKKEFVAVAGLDEVKAWGAAQPFVVTTAAKADVFLDDHLKDYYDFVQMGTRFPLEEEGAGGLVQIQLPLRQSDGTLVMKAGFLRGDEVHMGYLDDTPRNVIRQAFKLLHAPYGWGGMYGEQDCSRFLQAVFSTVGIQLPRNSGEQAKAGKVLARFDEKSMPEDKLKILRTGAAGGITVLGMRGHIMLFLGIVDERPYVIHATWAFRERQGSKQVARVMNKVVVSDLSLGEGSSKGSLLKRLRTVTEIGL